jgi:outer membrane protein assembly factor BamB
MRLIKLFFFLFLLSSCNKYLGTVEPDYSPSKEVTEIFSSNLNILDSKEGIIFGLTKYPYSKSFSKNFNFLNMQKIANINEGTEVYSNNNNIFFTKKNLLTKINKSDNKNKIDYKIVIDKDEETIQIYEKNDQIFLLTNKSKLFKLVDDVLNLELDLDTYINSNPILLEDKMIIFTVFGDVLELDLIKYDIKNKGTLLPLYGFSTNSNSYQYGEYRSYLFNSGSMIFLNKFDNQLQSNYYLEDLNILSSMNIFEEFVDAPFAFNDYLYFIEKKGFLSVFNPITSEILWEVDINSSIKDYSLSDQGNLALLTTNKIFILDDNGRLRFEFLHEIEDPISFIISSNDISIFNSNGINVFDINSKQKKDFIKSKFNSQLKIINFKSDIFINDTKVLYQISE